MNRIYSEDKPKECRHCYFYDKRRCILDRCYDILLQNNPYDRETIEEIMELIIDTVCSKRQYIRIAGDDKPCEVVKNQFLKLNGGHIEYVLASFRENATKVRNIKQYLLASLYNAPLTMSNYFDTLVRHDMANGFT